MLEFKKDSSTCGRTYPKSDSLIPAKLRSQINADTVRPSGLGWSEVGSHPARDLWLLFHPSVCSIHSNKLQTWKDTLLRLLQHRCRSEQQMFILHVHYHCPLLSWMFEQKTQKYPQGYTKPASTSNLERPVPVVPVVEILTSCEPSRTRPPAAELKYFSWQLITRMIECYVHTTDSVILGSTK